MTKYKITSGRTTIEFATEEAAQAYKLANNLEEEIETFEEELPLASIDFTAIVKDGINFGNDLIIAFAAENVSMGITQAGKTKAVADYLVDVTRYAQTGALYEVINEVDRLSTAGLPPELAPFITQTRLDAFKQKILDYLS